MIMEEPPKTGLFRTLLGWLYDAFTSRANTGLSLLVILLLIAFIVADKIG